MPWPLLSLLSTRRNRHSRGASAQRRLTLVGVMLVAGIAGADWQAISMQRAAAIEDFSIALTNLSTGMASQTSRALGTIDTALGEISASLGGMADRIPGGISAGLRGAAAHALLAEHVKRLSGVESLVIVDAAGHLANDMLAPAASRGGAIEDAARQGFFRELSRSGTGDAISPPIHATASGKWTAFLGRRITDASGAYEGSILAELSLDEWEDFYRYAMPFHRSITVLRRDGTRLLRYPHEAGLAGRVVPAGAPFFAAESGGRYIGPDSFDGTPVITVVRPLRGLPLVIETSMAEGEVLAGWRRQRRWMILGGFGACAGVILLVRLFAVQMQRLALRNTQLDEARRQLDLAMSNMSQGLCFFDGEQRLIVCNRRFAEMHGLPPAAARPGVAFAELVAHWFAAGGPAGVTQAEYLMSRAAVAQSGVPHHSVLTLDDGRTFSIQQQPMPDGGWVATHEDITDRCRADEQIRFLARHDVLTGLANRSVLQERLTQALAAAARGQGFAVLYLDLDRFKTVNDTLGHAAGDEVLRSVAHRLLATLREGDTVARLGGDEFVVLQSGVQAPQSSAILAERIIADLSRPHRIGDDDVVIGVSIGIDVASGGQTEPDDLLKNADMALYIAKSEGRGVFRFFAPDMDAAVQNRHILERDLRSALERKEFVVHYQAIVDTRTGQPCGFEALLRWNHPVRGILGPDDFIGVAEETGLIVVIGEWVLRQACRDAAAWPDHMHVSVNLSPIQFRAPNLVEMVQDALRTAGLAASRLELEITESVLLEGNARNMAVMHAFRKSGIGVVMDDFGVGYSSLSYLLQFPFQRIKIDRCFVKDLGKSADSASVVRAIVGLCRDLGIKTTAEGVETAEQLRVLTGEGCTTVQGYLFSRPKPAAQIGAWPMPQLAEPQVA